MNHPTKIAGWLFLLACLSSLPVNLVAQDLTPQEKQAVRRIKTNIDRAGKQYTAKKMELAKQYYDEASRQIGELSTGARAEIIEAIKPEHERLKVAHQLLGEAGLEMQELIELPEPMSADGESISFTKQVAPILVAKCGNCHVRGNRGDFSAATFEALDASTMIAYGLPDDSRLVEVIVSGEMPKGGLKVEPAELQTLKLWIKQGAKYDGDNPRQPLTELAGDNQPRRRQTMEPASPTGKETVSFGLEIAPILVDNCGQCHITNNPRGNLDLGSFRTLLAGGDAGPVITPGKASDSFLFQRIEAGEMPPNGKLDAKSIALIQTWINEGASFDGRDPRMEMQTVAATAFAASQSHDELAASRRELASKTWNLVMDGVDPVVVPSENFVVTGSTTESRLTDVAQLLEEMRPKIASALRADSSDPLVKGNVSTFVFDKRYDFSEFGKMVEQRDFPKEQTSHWNYTTIDAYAAVLMTRNEDAEALKVPLAQQMGALHVASLAPDVPRWFADGMGLWAAKKVYSREDQMKQLDSEAEARARSMKAPDDFLNNRMPSDQAAMVSYLFVKVLKSDSGRFNRLMASMKKGESFEASFVQAYGASPEDLVKKAKW